MRQLTMAVCQRWHETLPVCATLSIHMERVNMHVQRRTRGPLSDSARQPTSVMMRSPAAARYQQDIISRGFRQPSVAQDARAAQDEGPPQRLRPAADAGDDEVAGGRRHFIHRVPGAGVGHKRRQQHVPQRSALPALRCRARDLDSVLNMLLCQIRNEW